MHLSWPGGPLRGTAQLPASKSESNRALVLQALAGGGHLANLSDAHDTQLMRRLLAAAPGTDWLDAEDAGTVMRFLTAYLAVTGWQGHLTGTARMQQRPIAVLVEALRQLGAQIDYEGVAGFPPLRFAGFAAPAGAAEMPEVAVRGDISSQYISALLLIGAHLPWGLRLRLVGMVASRPYIGMTLALLRQFGIAVEETEEDGRLTVAPGTYRPADYGIEADWSAASYWYALVALAPLGSEIVLPGLRRHSWQGDQAIAQLMTYFGVATTYESGGVRLVQIVPPPLPAHPLDFTHCPDLAQTVAVVAAARRQPVRFTGLESLRIKETDRILALQTELAKFDAGLREEANGVFAVVPVDASVSTTRPTVHTYHDHRMAMAFAPLALRGPLQIEDPEVVRKSYPQFWQELRKVGFSAQQ